MGSVNTAVIRCPDPRCSRVVREKLESAEGLREDQYALTTAFGASISIRTIGPWIQEATRLLGINNVIVIDHRDCKYFLDLFGEDNHDDHVRNLIEATGWIETMFPGLTTRMFIVPDDGRGNLLSEIEEILPEVETTLSSIPVGVESS